MTLDLAIFLACGGVWLAVIVLAVLVTVKHGMFRTLHRWGRQAVCDKGGRKPGTEWL